jgi:hypothetical protein
MRRKLQLSLIWLAVGVVGACKPDSVITTDNIPTAGVRFINAVPDTNQMDFRFVDIVENNVQFRIVYRNTIAVSGTGAAAVFASAQIQYKPAQAGSRHYRIFLNDPAGSQVINSTVIKDGTTTLEAGKNYTFLLWGYASPTGPGRPAGAPAMKLDIIEESVADPGAQVALRVINATKDPIDVRRYVSTGTAPATATWANVAGQSIATYQTVAPDTFQFNVQPAGGGAALFADSRAMIGCPANDGKSGTFLPCQGIVGPVDALPGTTVAGSAVTMIVFPRSVAGTPAPQTTSAPSYATPQPSFMWDRRPPRPPGT